MPEALAFAVSSLDPRKYSSIESSQSLRIGFAVVNWGAYPETLEGNPNPEPLSYLKP